MQLKSIEKVTVRWAGLPVAEWARQIHVPLAGGICSLAVNATAAGRDLIIMIGRIEKPLVTSDDLSVGTVEFGASW